MNKNGKNHLKAGVPFSLSAAGLLAGFFSILKSAEGDFVSAARLIMLAMVLDGLDGNIARWLKATSLFGAEFDTFVDITCFGVAPAVLAYEAVFRHFGPWGIILPSLLVIMGAARLARFRIVNPDRGQDGYVGLPITIAAGWITLFIFVESSDVLIETGFSLTHGPWSLFVWGISLVMLLLEISTIRYPKLTKDPVFFFPAVLLVAMIFAWPPVAVATSLLICLSGLVFVTVGPLAFSPDSVAGKGDKSEELVVFRSSGER
ncbi:MAG: CDP-diacylglycerol--serine O-phosphatidyltransferase [Verrucomicrobia bacterium]|nr:MAG: CDP-diacylglycerol--serine O-phosphatidyltransferase [Verrucomicrobiota bacterium]